MRTKAAVPIIVAVLAALALGVVQFAGADDAAPEFHTGNNPATLDAFGPMGGHEYYLRFTNAKGENTDAKCSTRTASLFTATNFPVTSIKTSVGFNGCTLNGETAAAAVNGCEYEFKLVAGSEPVTATLDIVCPFGKKIEFESSKCRIDVWPQKGLKHVIYSNNEAAPTDVTETFSITGLEYTVSGFCPGQTKSETKTNGIYTDGLTVQATNAGKFVAVYVE